MPNSKKRKRWLTVEREAKLGSYMIDMSKILAAGYILKFLTGEKTMNWLTFCVVTLLWGLLLFLGLHLSALEGKK